MTELRAGMALAFRRIGRIESIVGALVGLFAVVMVTLIERRASTLYAADRSLGGIALGITLPLIAYGWVTRAFASTRLDSGLSELARHGGNRRLLAFGVLAVPGIGTAIFGALLAALAVIVARAPSDPLLVHDLVTSTWIGGLAGPVYVCWFGLASTFGTNGGGRFWALVFDWMFGASSSAVALPWPRGHIQNLLGADAPLAMPQWAAVLALAFLGGFYLTFALVRAPK